VRILPLVCAIIDPVISSSPSSFLSLPVILPLPPLSHQDGGCWVVVLTVQTSGDEEFKTQGEIKVWDLCGMSVSYYCDHHFNWIYAYVYKCQLKIHNHDIYSLQHSPSLSHSPHSQNVPPNHEHYSHLPTSIHQWNTRQSRNIHATSTQHPRNNHATITQHPRNIHATLAQPTR
jgi:hypothetical protein